MVNETLDNSYLTFGEYQASVLIWKVVPPILISFGTVGNILSIVVLTRKLIKTSTTALYLTFLAFSDLLVLYTGLLRQWLKFLTKKDLRHVSEAACKIHIWLVYSSLDFSAWILIAVTLERVISTWCPHNAKTKCSKKYATILLIGIIFLCLGLNSHLLFGMVDKVSEDGKSVQRCSTIDDNYSAFFNLTWPWIDLCAFCLIPFSVIVVGNGCILFKVIKSRKKARPRVQPSMRSLHGNSQNHHNHSSMTAMLFTLNMVFLFTTSPISIYNIGYPIWLEGASQETQASLEFWWAVVNMLMYTNNSLNFLLYCLSGSKFRQEVKRLFCPTSNESSNITLNDVKRTRGRTNSQIPSRTPSLAYSRDVSYVRNPTNPLDDRLNFNGFADINSVFQITAVKDTGLKTTSSAITEMIREASNVTSSIIGEQDRMQIRNENDKDLNTELCNEYSINNTISESINNFNNVKSYQSNDCPKQKTIQILPMSHVDVEKTAHSDKMDTKESGKRSSGIHDGVKIRTIKVMPSLDKDEDSLNDESKQHCDYFDKVESIHVPSHKHTSAKLKTINVLPCLDNDEDLSDTVEDSESLNDSENYTQDEESSVLSGCKGDNKTSLLNDMYERNNSTATVNYRVESPKVELESVKHLFDQKVDETYNETSTHLLKNIHITADETTHSKETKSRIEKQTINTDALTDEFPVRQLTKSATLDDGTNLESVSSV